MPGKSDGEFMTSADGLGVGDLDPSRGRPTRGMANQMLDTTAQYGREWQAALREIALKRALQGIFPREFKFEADPQKVRKEIAGAIRAKVKENKGAGPLIVLLGGGGAAGKSTFYLKIETELRDELAQPLQGGRLTDPVARLELDQYFYPVELIRGREADGKYDNPLNSDLLRARKNIEDLRAGHPVVVPDHDRREHLLAKQTCREAAELKNARVVIVEGLYSLGPGLRDLGDVAIYIDASALDRAKGRVSRDINVRARTEGHVVTMLMEREVYHQTFVEPTQAVADYVVRREHTEGRLLVTDGVCNDCLKTAGIRLGLDAQTAASLLPTFYAVWDEYLKQQAAKTGRW